MSQDEHARVLQAFLPQLKLGWTEAALIAGAREVGLSPSIIGSFPRKEAALVEFFMDDCLQSLVDRIDSDEELKNLTPSNCIYKIVRIRLKMHSQSTFQQVLSRGLCLLMRSCTQLVIVRQTLIDFRDTWAFLDARVNEAFDIEKSIQEAQYLAEAVGARMGSSLQGFVRTVFPR